MSSLILQVSDLSVELDGRTVFDGIGFDVREGQTLVISGPNGAGKTVLLRTLLGLIPPGQTRGKVAWKDDVKIGYVPQRVPLQRDLPITVEDFFQLKGCSPQRAHEALHEVGLAAPQFPRRSLGLISSGQFQRVLVAWALVGDPNVLVLDEPVSGIDEEGEETIHALIRKMRARKSLTMILVTHDPEVAEDADRVLRLRPHE